MPGTTVEMIVVASGCSGIIYYSSDGGRPGRSNGGDYHRYLAADDTVAGTGSLIVGVSGGIVVSSSVGRTRKFSILHKSSLVWYLVVCFVHAIDWVSVVVGKGMVTSVGTTGHGNVWRAILCWVSIHFW
jgi:hypothetical protein